MVRVKHCRAYKLIFQYGKEMVLDVKVVAWDKTSNSGDGQNDGRVVC